MEAAFPLRSAFIAIPLEGEAKMRFAELRDSLAPFCDCLSLQSADTPHLTLRFWRELMQIEYEPILVHMKNIAAEAEAFDLRIVGADTFGDRMGAKVLFLVPEFSDPLSRLSKRCPWPQDRPFTPHVTLARVRHPQSFAVWKKGIMKIVSDADFSIKVDRIRLYAEVAGKKQTPLHEEVFG